MNTLRRDEGASAVEFALVVSLLILLIFGIVEFGLAWHRRQGLEAAAREGARIASVGFTIDKTLERVRTAQSLFDPNDIEITVAVNGTALSTLDGSLRPCQVGGIGSLVTVNAVVPEDAANDYGILIPLWGQADIRYETTGSFRCEKANAN